MIKKEIKLWKLILMVIKYGLVDLRIIIKDQNSSQQTYLAIDLISNLWLNRILRYTRRIENRWKRYLIID